MPQEFDPTGYNPAMFHPHAQYGPPAGPYNASLSPPGVPGAYVPGAPFIAPEPLPFIVAPEPQHLPFAANERMEKLQNDLARLRTGDEVICSQLSLARSFDSLISVTQLQNVFVGGCCA